MILQPASNPKDPILCELVRTNLRIAPDFEALSYRCGSEQDSRKHIIVYNKYYECDYVVKINLWEALYNLRDANDPRTLWVDAISINQADLEEKSHQVRHMRQIYERAKRALIWLGPEAEDSDFALSFHISYWGVQME